MTTSWLPLPLLAVNMPVHVAPLRFLVFRSAVSGLSNWPFACPSAIFRCQVSHSCPGLVPESTAIACPRKSWSPLLRRAYPVPGLLELVAVGRRHADAVVEGDRFTARNWVRCLGRLRRLQRSARLAGRVSGRRLSARCLSGRLRGRCAWRDRRVRLCVATLGEHQDDAADRRQQDHSCRDDPDDHGAALLGRRTSRRGSTGAAADSPRARRGRPPAAGTRPAGCSRPVGDRRLVARSSCRVDLAADSRPVVAAGSRPVAVEWSTRPAGIGVDSPRADFAVDIRPGSTPRPAAATRPESDSWPPLLVVAEAMPRLILRSREPGRQ